MRHFWQESSGTTDVCRVCGCWRLRVDGRGRYTGLGAFYRYRTSPTSGDRRAEPPCKEPPIHVMPLFGKQHEESSACWCQPKMDSVAKDRLWIHEPEN